jgi:hypothetical protein
MASQNPKDWEFSLFHLPNDSIQVFQPLTFRRLVENETETFEHHIQPYLDLESNKFH